ncbi:MAG: hypothetical protein M3O66_07155 [Verrucomicrobiota bacterium]|nr:hypothetical protein [Verrucomicrobiota bacterium]
MTRQLTLALLLVAALFMSALRLPAQSCLLSSSAIEKACRPGCCANKTCCATSARNTVIPSQPLAKNSATHELAAVVAHANPTLLPDQGSATKLAVRSQAQSAAHSPPRLALFCTFLI